jgi:hypothetical protein
LYSEELRAAWTLFDTYVEDVISTKVAKKIAAQDKKFSTLFRQQNSIPISLTDFMINKSSCIFTEEGTNEFAISLKAPLLVDIITSIESGIQY